MMRKRRGNRKNDGSGWRSMRWSRVVWMSWCGVLIGWMGVAGCGRKDPGTAVDAVAWVGGRPVLATTLDTEIRRRSAGGLPVDRDKVLAELIELEAAYGRAIASGFLERPEMQRAIRLLVAERLRQNHESEVAADTGMGEERARALYAASTNRFIRPEAWNVAWIQLEVPRKATEEKKAHVMERARALKQRAETEARGLTHFGVVAADASADQSTRYRGGELGWMTAAQMEARMDPAVVAAVKALGAAGLVSEPVAGADGVYLLKLMGRRAAQLRPFDEVRPQLDHELATRARQERDDRWSRWCREGVEVRVVTERLARVEVPKGSTNGPTPPRPMSGR